MSALLCLARFKRIGAALLLGAGMAVQAQAPPNITKGEVALLPPYCPDTQSFGYGDAYSNPSPRAGYWIDRMGKTFWALHHHCWALIKVRRAMLPGVAPVVREGMLRSAINDYQYVLDNEKPGFKLAPEVLVKMGDAYVLLNDFGNASVAYGRARGLKPDYWPPYAQWADVLDKVGKRSAALQHLEEGMHAAPDALPLRAQYKRLGGDPTKFAATQRAPARPAAPPANPAAPTPAPLPPAASAAPPAAAASATPAASR